MTKYVIYALVLTAMESLRHFSVPTRLVYNIIANLVGVVIIQCPVETFISHLLKKVLIDLVQFRLDGAEYKSCLFY